jgi:hypothetical protein
MFALGHSEPAGDIDPGHPEIHAAMTAARVFRADSKFFVNLSLYEQRLQRTLKESLRQLKELQAERIAARKIALAEAAPKAAPKSDPAPTLSQAGQFVCSTPEMRSDIPIYEPANNHETPLKQADSTMMTTNQPAHLLPGSDWQ